MLKASVQVWHWYSLDQAVAATIAARKCHELELNPPALSPEEREKNASWSLWGGREHRSYAIASITASVAFLEACMNELYASAADPRLEIGGKLPENDRKALRDVETMIGSNALLDRYQLTLRLLGKLPFDRGVRPFQDAALVVRLRNELIHYKPRWRGGGEDENLSSDAFRGAQALFEKGFSIHPFTTSGNPFFPDRCLGYDCASWAWKTVDAFAIEFFGRIGIESLHDRFRIDLRL